MARPSKPRPPRVPKPDLASAQGERLKRARLRAGYSFQDLAVAAGVSSRQVRNIEAGQAPNVSAVILAQLADALDVGRCWLAFGS